MFAPIFLETVLSPLDAEKPKASLNSRMSGLNVDSSSLVLDVPHLQVMVCNGHMQHNWR